MRTSSLSCFLSSWKGACERAKKLRHLTQVSSTEGVSGSLVWRSYLTSWFSSSQTHSTIEIGIVNDFGWIVIITMLCSITLRVWANRTLGKFYTRTLLITESHNVVQERPYKKVCHPGYLGIMLMWVGAGLATVNWIAAAIITLTTVAAYQCRINCEEDVPVSSIGKHYKEYVKNTWRLIPFAY